MTRNKLLSEIEYALSYIQYNEEERKEVKKALKKLKQDLKDLAKIKQENQELTETLELYNEKFAGHERVKADLIKENQELKCKYEIYDFLYQNEVSKNGALAGKIFEKDLKIQKLEKALEIIKNKGIDYHSISAIKQSKDYEDYLDLVKNLITVVFKFTKQEYELLKEVFCND